jgi:hypothetical protein
MATLLSCAVPDLVELHDGFVPAALHGANRNAEQRRRVGLRQALLEDQRDDFALVVRQRVHLIVELAPLGQ